MKILILDNYDSFTYNLVQLVKENSSFETDVFRNDEIGLEEASRYSKIILSPGPGVPSEAGIMYKLIEAYKESKSIFGVCLGMQAIAEVFGGHLVNMKKPFHGVATKVHHFQTKLFTGIPLNFNAGRYHSWAVATDSLPEDIKISAVDENGTIMAIEHNKYDVSGVQFHPESILTEYGNVILMNFLNKR